jgi:hypothetical protein
VPEALDWLDSVRLPDDKIMPGKPRYPTFIQIGNGRPLYVHRRARTSSAAATSSTRTRKHGRPLLVVPRGQ